MKVLILVYALIIASCGSEQTSPIANKDTIATELPDSTTLKDETIAISTIPFGIRQSDFNKLKDQYIKSLAFKKYENSSIHYYKIGEYEVSQIGGDFLNDSLYKVEVSGSMINYEKYDADLRPQYSALLESISIKHGPPYRKRLLPSWTEIEKGYYQICAEWKIGKRIIEIQVHCLGVYYQIVLVSYRKDFYDRISEAEREKQNESIKSGSDKI